MPPTPEIPDPDTGTEGDGILLSIQATDFLRKLVLTIAFNTLRKTSRAGTDSGTGVGTAPDTDIDMGVDTDSGTESGTRLASRLVGDCFRFVLGRVLILRKRRVIG